ncbi:uncharacterized protein HD556DRAFT_1309044 [Suillus plorans]|uniref:Secreted protein n=1 Tax=Suillus plorans TaxID=116603 RepID=A0A9P7APM2_9AGAM|nr:uncharacterized protein HD556DRAFT_1309044 [Suillus plorans]KAG1792746.1 hypothetical protein HD556DRAFT_1309044 [Suillus plorans]
MLASSLFLVLWVLLILMVPIPTHYISAFFSPTVWELPHNTKNIDHFWNHFNINYSHTLPTSLQLHHHTKQQGIMASSSKRWDNGKQQQEMVARAARDGGESSKELTEVAASKHPYG